MSLSIGIEVTAAVRQGGGIGRYTRELLRALAERQDDIRYRLFYASPAPIPHPLPPFPAHFTTRHLPFHDIWLARLWHRARVPLPVQACTGAVDLYHSPDFTLPPVLGKIPTLLTVHDLSFVRDPASAAPGLRAYLNQVVPRSVARATHILADSQATKDDLIALYNTPHDKVTVLYSGVTADFTPVQDPARLQAVRAKYGLGEAPFALAVSTLQPRKNFTRLIQAFDQALRHQPANLVICGGKGWLYDEIFAEVQARGLGERVLFPGFVADEDLPALYSAARLFAYPSLYEGFGLPLLEAMACGSVVLTSQANCLPEVAGNAAYLADPLDVNALADALHRLWHEDHLRAQLRQAGFARARQFRWQASAAQLVGIYRELAASRDT
ncbi:MAG TPA: glycosyltransferase family 1 protein [Anaerolineales bacterium]|nr:glycosyltransferase family 1 protein [Anaerolineales bacterium]